MRINQKTVIEETVTLTEEEMFSVNLVLDILNGIVMKSADDGELEQNAQRAYDNLEDFVCTWLTNIL